jgi:hypothetical protein
MRRPLAALLLAVLVVSTPAAAQFGRRGGDRSQSQNAQNAQDVLALPPWIPPGVAALVLSHAGDFALTDSQRVVLESIRETQDSANRPWMARLDSLRPQSQPLNPRDLSQEQRDEIAARRARIAAVLDGMRETNALARQRTMAILSPAQQQRAAELENDARKQADQERERRGRFAADGRDANRRGGRGRPPED